MTKHILRLLLTAAAFYFVFPLIPGVEFHGNFIHALLAGVLFSILAQQKRFSHYDWNMN